MSQSCGQADLVNQRVAWILWGGPAALLAIGALVGPLARTLLWTPALSVAGAACVLNAARCHRLHCYLTGPLFLLGAAATVLGALDVVPIDWRWILGSMIVGTAVGYALERAQGKYVGGEAMAGRPAP